MSKGKKILCGILAGIVIASVVAAICVIKYYTSAEYKILTALETKDYDKAIELYKDEMNGEENKKLNDKTVNAIGYYILLNIAIIGIFTLLISIK